MPEVVGGRKQAVDLNFRALTRAMKTPSGITQFVKPARGELSQLAIVHTTQMNYKGLVLRNLHYYFRDGISLSCSSNYTQRNITMWSIPNVVVDRLGSGQITEGYIRFLVTGVAHVTGRIAGD